MTHEAADAPATEVRIGLVIDFDVEHAPMRYGYQREVSHALNQRHLRFPRGSRHSSHRCLSRLVRNTIRRRHTASLRCRDLCRSSCCRAASRIPYWIRRVASRAVRTRIGRRVRADRDAYRSFAERPSPGTQTRGPRPNVISRRECMSARMFVHLPKHSFELELVFGWGTWRCARTGRHKFKLYVRTGWRCVGIAVPLHVYEMVSFLAHRADNADAMLAPYAIANPEFVRGRRGCDAAVQADRGASPYGINVFVERAAEVGRQHEIAQRVFHALYPLGVDWRSWKLLSNL